MVSINRCQRSFYHYLSFSSFCTSAKSDLFYMSGYQALQKKRRKEKVRQLEWKPETLTLDETKWIMDASKSNEIMRIVTESMKKREGRNHEENKDIMSVIFNCAIRKCVELQSYPQCWTLFVCAKQSNYANMQLYTTMIWMLTNSAKRSHFNKALALYKEMKDLKMSPSMHTYCALINGCAKKLCFEQGMEIWQDLEQDKNAFADIKAWNAIISLLCFNKNMEKAAQSYHDMVHNANIAADNYTFCLLINGYSANISFCQKHKIENFDVNALVNNAQNIMYDAVIALDKNQNKLDLNGMGLLIRAFMNLYATIGDYRCCLVIFEWILEKNDICDFDLKIRTNKEKDLKRWLNEEDNALNYGCYKLKIHFFGIVLKSLLNDSSLNGKKLKKMIDKIMDVLQNKCDITPSTDIYGILFQLFRRLTEVSSVEELEGLYVEMKTKSDSKPTERELNEYGRTYLHFMEHNEATYEQKKDFTDLLMKEFIELNVTPSIYTKQLLEGV